MPDMWNCLKRKTGNPDFDVYSPFTSFDLEFTVNSEYVAVSNGKLLYQVLLLWPESKGSI